MSKMFESPLGEVTELPDVSLDIRSVKHLGHTLAVLIEVVEGDDRFAGIHVPEDRPEGYGNAAIDYMQNVVKLSLTVAGGIWNTACLSHAKGGA